MVQADGARGTQGQGVRELTTTHEKKQYCSRPDRLLVGFRTRELRHDASKSVMGLQVRQYLTFSLLLACCCEQRVLGGRILFCSREQLVWLSCGID